MYSFTLFSLFFARKFLILNLQLARRLREIIDGPRLVLRRLVAWFAIVRRRVVVRREDGRRLRVGGVAMIAAAVVPMVVVMIVPTLVVLLILLCKMAMRGSFGANAPRVGGGNLRRRIAGPSLSGRPPIVIS